MSIESSRRGFLGGLAAVSSLSAAAAAPAAAANTAGPGGKLKLGVASYSLRAFQRRPVIRALKKLGVDYVNIKDFHLPMTPLADVAKGAEEFRKAGLTITGGGTVSFLQNDPADIRAKFEYAKAAGMPLIVAAPNFETLPKLEPFVKEYDIKIAVHNHGTEDKFFPNPQAVLKLIKGMDPRMGVCFDIGHAIRTGVEVVETAKECGDRLLDMHMKDLSDPMSRDSQVPVGDGKIPIIALMKQLKAMNYQGGIMLEYEIDEDNPVPGMQKSLAYLRGVRDTLG